MSISLTTNQIDRTRLADWYKRNRARSAEIFGLIDSDAHYERPILLRHPFIFYEGHLPAFSFLTLNERSLGEAPIDPAFEKLFERGIDPGSLEIAHKHDRASWPSRAEVAAFAKLCDERVLDAFASAELVSESNPRLVRGQAAYTVLEHEQMHHETLMYIVSQLDPAKKRQARHDRRDGAPPKNAFVRIDAGSATLGADLGTIPFGWDNEFGQQRVDVAAFEIQQYPITNADWLEFVANGGPLPPFWVQRDGEMYLRVTLGEIPLPKSWPVYVSHDIALRYAAWKDARLPTEAEFHRAAFGTPSDGERRYPWGDQQPAPHHGNFGFVRYDPEPVDAHPEGISAWGLYDLVGNGWELTSTQFAPLPGFAPMASYPQYSADFFDGRHFVLKGASAVTGTELIRRSFRNWFYGDYPYAYTKFRLARTI